MDIKYIGTIADTARHIKNNVNLGRLCKNKGQFFISNFRLNDNSTLKLLEGPNEVDCLIMKNGKVLTAKGTFVKNNVEAESLATRIIEEKIANRPDIVSYDINATY